MKSTELLIAVTGILTFAFLGAIQALYGPLLPGFQRAFGIDTTTVGFLFTAHGLGALLGIVVPSLLRVPILGTHWLSFATSLLLAGAAALWIAPTWPAVLAAALVLAVGFGIHVVRLNSLFVAGFGTRGMTMSQLINAGFSVGAILGPLVVGWWGRPSERIFGAVAILALALFPLCVVADRRGRMIAVAAPAGDAKADAPAQHRTRSRALLAGFVALMALTVGVENSIGGWTTTLALANGYSFSSAANLTALFFGSIFAGRLLAAAAGHRLRPAALVLGAIACIAALLAISIATPAGSIAFAFAGFAIAPIFSATLVWLGAALPTGQHASALVIAGALLGSAIFPPLIGRVIGQLGVAAAAPAILCITLAAFGVALWIRSFLRRS